jgi:hypothetical protein
MARMSFMVGNTPNESDDPISFKTQKFELRGCLDSGAAEITFTDEKDEEHESILVTKTELKALWDFIGCLLAYHKDKYS